MTPRARIEIEECFESYDWEVLEELDGHGFCHECGNLQHGVEPDAVDYECEVCGVRNVQGLLTTVVEMI